MVFDPARGVFSQLNSKIMVREYYNQWVNKLTHDFLIGNSRQVEAIKFVQSRLYADCKTILDIGCGIGWSSYELARVMPNARIVGVDISPDLIEQGRKMFKLPNLELWAADVNDLAGQSEFDTVVMLDFYEHFAGGDDVIGSLVRHDGQILLTCPTMLHQNFLRQNLIPMQPIDRDVDIEDVINLARRYGLGWVTHFEYVDIYHSNDHFHAAIEMHPTFDQEWNGRVGITPFPRRVAMARQLPSWGDLKYMAKRLLNLNQ